MHYLIRPNCTTPQGGPLALSINPNNPGGQLVVNSSNPADPAQLWTPISYFAQNGSSLGMALINAKTGTALNSNSTGNGLIANTVGGLSDLGLTSTWTLGGEKGGFYALRPLGNVNVNLNVAGNAPYASGTNVIVYKWGGGGSNEIWQFVSVDFNPPG